MDDHRDPERERRLQQALARGRDALSRRRERIGDVDTLVGGPIDRHFPLPLDEFSDSELDVEMGKRASRINQDLNLKRQIDERTHRRWVKVLLLIPTLVKFLISKPRHILKDFSVFNHILFLRLRRLEKQMEDLRTDLGNLEVERLDISDREER